MFTTQAGIRLYLFAIGTTFCLRMHICTECSLVLIVLPDATSHGCFFLAINDHISDTSACGHMFWDFPKLVFPKGPNQIHKSPTNNNNNNNNKNNSTYECLYP